MKEIHRKVTFHLNKANNTQTVSTIHSYTLIPAKGKKSFFMDNPGPVIEQAVTAHQFPRVLEDYTAGKMLTFGWLELNHEGLYLSSKLNERELAKIQGTWAKSGERFVSWQNLASSWIDETRSTLILNRRGERKHWAILPLYDVANPALYLALIEQVLTKTTRVVD